MAAKLISRSEERLKTWSGKIPAPSTCGKGNPANDGSAVGQPATAGNTNMQDSTHLKNNYNNNNDVNENNNNPAAGQDRRCRWIWIKAYCLVSCFCGWCIDFMKFIAKRCEVEYISHGHCQLRPLTAIVTATNPHIWPQSSNIYEKEICTQTINYDIENDKRGLSVRFPTRQNFLNKLFYSFFSQPLRVEGWSFWGIATQIGTETTD